MSDDLDELSEFLGAEDQTAVDQILTRLSEITFPDVYRDVIRVARESIELYSDLLADLGTRESFEDEDDENGVRKP